MSRKNLVSLDKYENIATGDIFYGYPLKDAVKKDIDGVTYVEVTNSIVRPKLMFIKLENLKLIGDIVFERP